MSVINNCAAGSAQFSFDFKANLSTTTLSLLHRGENLKQKMLKILDSSCKLKHHNSIPSYIKVKILVLSPNLAVKNQPSHQNIKSSFLPQIGQKGIKT